MIYLVGSRHVSRGWSPRPPSCNGCTESRSGSCRFRQRAGTDHDGERRRLACDVAPNLLFMSPDVIADSPGWLGTLLAFKADMPDAGAVGPKLLYEDGSVQHAGVYFDRVSPQELRFRSARSMTCGSFASASRECPRGSPAWRSVPRGRGVERGAAGRARPVRAGRGLSEHVSQGRLRGRRPVLAPRGGGPHQLVRPRREAAPPRGPLASRGLAGASRSTT